MKSIFEQFGGVYTMQGDYRLPNLTLPAEEERPIGVWGQRHLRYLKENRRVLLSNLQLSGMLNSYLADIDQQAQEMFERLVKQMAERDGVTEQLKAADPMKWVARMNNIRSRATEFVNNNLIFVY